VHTPQKTVTLTDGGFTGDGPSYFAAAAAGSGLSAAEAPWTPGLQLPAAALDASGVGLTPLGFDSSAAAAAAAATGTALFQPSSATHHTQLVARQFAFTVGSSRRAE